MRDFMVFNSMVPSKCFRMDTAQVDKFLKVKCCQFVAHNKTTQCFRKNETQEKFFVIEDFDEYLIKNTNEVIKLFTIH